MKLKPTQQIEPERICPLNEHAARAGGYVLYWMQQSQRAEFNHALEHAIQQANECNQPVVAVFGLTDKYPDANLRHYAFMIEGLVETAQRLRQRGVQLVLLQDEPTAAALALAAEASLVVCDRGYLRHHRQWRDHVADESAGAVVQVESDIIVPVETASQKAEFAARTFRPRVNKHVKRFLRKLSPTPLRRDSLGLRLGGQQFSDAASLLESLKLDRSVPPSPRFGGGADEARRRVKDFVRNHLGNYVRNRNRPAAEDVSHMSPYLHFGQVSPLEVALAVSAARGASENDKHAYLEELIVRRELAINFVTYQPRYDSFDGLPDWAQRTLKAHAGDKREHVYSELQLAAGRTHDEYWNASMLEMRSTGYMHNHMRMYWGKKVIEWTSSPRRAFAVMQRLNDRYFIDGRDPASYANVAWVFGQHDRAWRERPIFGKVRYMSASGLERKADPAAYVAKVAQWLNGNKSDSWPGAGRRPCV